MDALIGKTSHARPFSFDGSQRGEADRIMFSLTTCDIGCVLVASSDVGICAILIGSDADEVTGDLSTRFPGSILERNDEALRRALGKVVQFISAPSEGLDLPLDIRGTPFQRQVYETLRTVRVGAVITYGALARRIGKPNAVRAVARACANNPLAIAIPCHRVVRTNGALGGYRWEIERKRTLLDREALS